MKYLDSFEQSKKKIENFLKVFENAIDCREIDKFEWKTIFNCSPKLQEIEAEGKKIHENYITILQDLFYSLYKLSPKFIDTAQLSQETGFFNKSIIEQIMNMSRYEELRVYTTSDEMNSAISVVAFSEQLHEMVKEKIEEYKNKQEELKKRMEDMQKLLDSLDPQSDDDIPDDVKDLIEGLAKDLQGAQADVVPDIGDISDTIDTIINMTETNETLKRTWGLQKNNTFIKLPYQQKQKVFERLRNSKKLMEISDMLGKFKGLLNREENTTISKEIASLQKTKMSDEITHAIPAELMKFVDEEMEWLFWIKAGNHSLETYDYEQDNEEIKGPIVIAIDESGSMSGTREIWSKACALAVLHQAKVDNRSVYVIHFAHQRQAKDTHINKFPKDQDLDIEQVIDMAEHFYNGGTSFNQPFEQMMTCVDEEEGFSRADGLFITDGECQVSQEILKNLGIFKEEKGFRLFGIHLGSWGDTELEKFCNSVYNIKELTNDLFMKINNKLLKD